jgi:hypothetical protein
MVATSAPTGRDEEVSLESRASIAPLFTIIIIMVVVVVVVVVW